MKDLTVDTLFINSHSRHRHKPCLVSGQNRSAYLVRQVGKNGTPVSHYRLVIPDNEHYCIANVYEDRRTKSLYAKILTTLSERQLSSSRNMNHGEPASDPFRVHIQSIRHEEKFFDYKDFKDFFNEKG